MRAKPVLSATLVLALAACGRADEAADNEIGGMPGEGERYSGVGIYPADSLWNEIESARVANEAGATNDAQAARKDDDNQIIVLVDRQTGEVRQCGNRSGFCVAMNPWQGKGRDKTPQLPAELNRHASDLANEAEAEQRAAEKAAKAK